MIDVADGGLLWSGVYEPTAAEMFALQENISEQIATKIEAHLAPKLALRVPRFSSDRVMIVLRIPKLSHH